MNSIPLSNYENIQKQEFEDQLKALTKTGFFFNRYLIATKEGGLATTNFFKAAWETYKKRTNANLVESRVMQLLKAGSKEAEEKDLASIHLLAQRSRLVPLTANRKLIGLGAIALAAGACLVRYCRPDPIITPPPFQPAPPSLPQIPSFVTSTDEQIAMGVRSLMASSRFVNEHTVVPLIVQEVTNGELRVLVKDDLKFPIPVPQIIGTGLHPTGNRVDIPLKQTVTSSTEAETPLLVIEYLPENIRTQFSNETSSIAESEGERSLSNDDLPEDHLSKDETSLNTQSKEENSFSNEDLSGSNSPKDEFSREVAKPRHLKTNTKNSKQEYPWSIAGIAAVVSFAVFATAAYFCRWRSRGYAKKEPLPGRLSAAQSLAREAAEVTAYREQFSQIIADLSKGNEQSADQLTQFHKRIVKEIDDRLAGWFRNEQVIEQLGTLANECLCKIFENDKKPVIDLTEIRTDIDNIIGNIIDTPVGNMNFEQIQSLTRVMRTLIHVFSLNDDGIDESFGKEASKTAANILNRVLSELAVGKKGFLAEQLKVLAGECWDAIVQSQMPGPPFERREKVFKNSGNGVVESSYYTKKNPIIIKIRGRLAVLNNLSSWLSTLVSRNLPVLYHEYFNNIGGDFRDLKLTPFWLTAFAHKKEGSIFPEIREQFLQHALKLRQKIIHCPQVLLLFDYAIDIVRQLPENTAILTQLKEMLAPIKNRQSKEEIVLRNQLIQAGLKNETQFYSIHDEFTFYSSGLQGLSEQFPCKHPLYPELLYLLTQFTMQKIAPPLSLQEILNRVWELSEKIKIKDQQFSDSGATDNDIRLMENGLLAIYECYLQTAKSWPMKMKTFEANDGEDEDGIPGAPEEKKSAQITHSKDGGNSVPPPGFQLTLKGPSKELNF